MVLMTSSGMTMSRREMNSMPKELASALVTSDGVMTLEAINESTTPIPFSAAFSLASLMSSSLMSPTLLNISSTVSSEEGIVPNPVANPNTS